MKESLYDRLVEVCRDQGIESPKSGDIARICGLSSGRPKQIKDSGLAARLGNDTLSRLVELGYSPTWLQEGKNPKLLAFKTVLPTTESAPENSGVRVDPEQKKILDGFVAADQTARETMLWLAERALAKRFRRTGGMSTGAPEVSTVIDQYLNNIEGLPEGQTLPLLQRTLEKNHQQQKTAKKDRDERPVPRRNNSSSKIS